MTREPEAVEAVRRKAERLRRARKRPESLFRTLVHVGVLGWLLVLPLLGLTALGHVLDQALGTRSLSISGLLAGLLLGAYLVWRSVSGSLQDEDESSPEAGGAPPRPKEPPKVREPEP